MQILFNLDHGITHIDDHLQFIHLQQICLS